MIFLYTNDTKITDATVALLRKAGYIPIKVSAFDDVRVVSPQTEAVKSLDIIAQCALETIADYTDGVPTTFGRRIAKRMVENGNQRQQIRGIGK